MDFFTVIFKVFFISYPEQLTTMLLNLIIKQSNKVFLLESLNFMSCVGEIKKSSLNLRIKKHDSKNAVQKFFVLQNFMCQIVSYIVNFSCYWSFPDIFTGLWENVLASKLFVNEPFSQDW